MINFKYIFIAFILGACVAIALPASALDVKIGDTINFGAANVAESAGPLEGIARKQDFEKPGFIEFTTDIDAQIDINKTSFLRFLVKDPGDGSRSGTLHFDYNISMQPSGLPCLSQGWEDALKPDWQVDNSWNRYLFVTVKDKPKKDSQDPAPVDTKNSDPTYIQLDRGVEAYAAEDEAYQFSPQSSPGAKDSLTITYNLAQDSLVSIYHYCPDVVRSIWYN